MTVNIKRYHLKNDKIGVKFISHLFVSVISQLVIIPKQQCPQFVNFFFFTL